MCCPSFLKLNHLINKRSVVLIVPYLTPDYSDYQNSMICWIPNKIEWNGKVGLGCESIQGVDCIYFNSISVFPPICQLQCAVCIVHCAYYGQYEEQTVQCALYTKVQMF